MEGITLDESARIRVLSADELAAAEELRQHTDRFVETVERLREMSGGIVDAVERKASLIDHEMLRAIGQRLEAANEEDNRKARLEKVMANERARLQVEAELNEKLQERDRLQVEYDSLLKVQRAQEMRIASLSIGEVQQ